MMFCIKIDTNAILLKTTFIRISSTQIMQTRGWNNSKSVRKIDAFGSYHDRTMLGLWSGAPACSGAAFTSIMWANTKGFSCTILVKTDRFSDTISGNIEWAYRSREVGASMTYNNVNTLTMNNQSTFFGNIRIRKLVINNTHPQAWITIKISQTPTPHHLTHPKSRNTQTRKATRSGNGKHEWEYTIYGPQIKESI